MSITFYLELNRLLKADLKPILDFTNVVNTDNNLSQPQPIESSQNQYP